MIAIADFGAQSQPRLQPLLNGTWPGFAGGAAFDIQVVEKFAYIALGQGGLAVFDVSSPTNVVPVGGYDTTGIAWNVHVVGSYAYVADGEAGLQVLDVSNPTNITRVGGYDTAGSAMGVDVAGSFAYVADYFAGLHVLDVSDPTKIVRVANYDTKGVAYGVHVADNKIYLAEGPNGLAVLASLPNLQLTLRVDTTTNVHLTLEATTSLVEPVSWTPLFTTNPPVAPFDFTDFAVRGPHKFYRTRQP
jgi:hypothetical protein